MATGNITSRTDELKIEIQRGTTFRMGFRPGTSTPGELGPNVEYYDLSAVALSFKVRNGDRSWVRDFTDHFIVEETDDGPVAYLTITPAETEQFFFRQNRYEFILDIIFPSGDIKRLLHGPIYVSPVGV